jgi:hypothetical protein
MAEVPKIVHHRLRAAWTQQKAAEQAHPHADLLAAFAEQALSATEREGVLQHLALCADCREVVALALPAEMESAPGVEATRATASRADTSAPRKPIFAWPSLRWVALAAGIVVAGALLLVHPVKLNQPMSPSENHQIAANTAPPAPSASAESPSTPSPSDQLAGLTKTDKAPSKQLQSPPTSVNRLVVSKAPPSPNPQIQPPSVAAPSSYSYSTSANADEARSKLEVQTSKRLKTGQAPLPAPTVQVESGIVIADNWKDSDKPAEPLPEGARALDLDAAASRGASEAVVVSDESPTVNVIGGTPVIKAKSAPQARGANMQKQSETAAAVGSLKVERRNVMSAVSLAGTPNQAAQHATWSITGGVLQKSLDNNQTWQTSLHADHPLLCYASRDNNGGGDVWTGGQAGALFHSSDNGVTWIQVQPSVKNQKLTSDITHIDVTQPGQIVLSTVNYEIWSSADNGKTWDKK